MLLIIQCFAVAAVAQLVKHPEKVPQRGEMEPTDESLIPCCSIEVSEKFLATLSVGV